MMTEPSSIPTSFINIAEIRFSPGYETDIGFGNQPWISVKWKWIIIKITLSYISPALIAGIPQSGEKEGFHPINGHFTAPTYNVETALGGKNFTMLYGTLPGLLGMSTDMAMSMSGSSAVIGTQLLEYFDCTLSWKEGTNSS